VYTVIIVIGTCTSTTLPYGWYLATETSILAYNPHLAASFSSPSGSIATRGTTATTSRCPLWILHIMELSTLGVWSTVLLLVLISMTYTWQGYCCIDDWLLTWCMPVTKAWCLCRCRLDFVPCTRYDCFVIELHVRPGGASEIYSDRDNQVRTTHALPLTIYHCTFHFGWSLWKESREKCRFKLSPSAWYLAM